MIHRAVAYTLSSAPFVRSEMSATVLWSRKLARCDMAAGEPRTTWQGCRRAKKGSRLPRARFGHFRWMANSRPSTSPGHFITFRFCFVPLSPPLPHRCLPHLCLLQRCHASPCEDHSFDRRLPGENLRHVFLTKVRSSLAFICCQHQLLE